MDLKTAQQHNAAQTGQHDFKPNPDPLAAAGPADQIKNYLPEVAKHPLRCSIRGDMHLIPELKKLIAASEIPDSLKTFLAEELDKMKSNGAQVDLHLLDHDNGDGSLTLHWKAVHFGARLPNRPARS